jgi:hypothetical protein
MSLPMPPNVTVDIYRGCSPAAPYLGGAPAVPGVKAYLQPRVQTGRHGTALYLKWTHILYTDATVDVRDAYNGQLNALTAANADTVVLTDPVNNTKTAFYVAYVELALKGTALAHFRVYLDRFQPQTWPSAAL